MNHARPDPWGPGAGNHPGLPDQVGVFLVGVTPGGAALLDHQLDLPEPWCESGKVAAERRQKAHIPETVAFRTKPQIAAALIRQTVALGIVALDWITADEAYGKNGNFLDEVEQLELRYVVEVPVTTTVWTEDPASCIPPYGGRGRVPTRPTRETVASVAVIASGLDRQAWRTLEVRPGAKGPLAFEFACVRVWAVRHGAAGPPIWLVVRRSLEPVPEVKYYVSNADAVDAAGGAGAGRLHATRGGGLLGGLQELPRDGAVRDAILGRLAPSHELGGNGSSVHHADAARPGKKTPELTLDRTVRLLQRAIEVPGLSLALALLLVDYHIRRNEVARRSHAKTWWARHKRVKLLPL